MTTSDSRPLTLSNVLLNNCYLSYTDDGSVSQLLKLPTRILRPSNSIVKRPIGSHANVVVTTL